MAKQVIVSGSAGYIGSVLCEHLLQAGYQVTVVDNLMYRQPYLCKIFSHEYDLYPNVNHIHFFGWYIGNCPGLE